MELLPSPEQLKNKIIIKARKSGTSDPLDVRNDGDDEVDEDAAANNQSSSVDLLRLDDETSEKRRHSTQSTSSSKSKKSTSSVECPEVVVTERKIPVASQECPKNDPIPEVIHNPQAGQGKDTKLDNNNTQNEQLPQSNPPVENPDANRRSSTNRGNPLMNRTDAKKLSKKKSSSPSMYVSATEYVVMKHSSEIPIHFKKKKFVI